LGRRHRALGGLGPAVMKFADPTYWRGRRVLVTGHTGFKGAWLSLRLRALGAEVTGLALTPPTTPSLFDLAGLSTSVQDLRADIRDFAATRRAVDAARPQIVFHLAAQSLVKVGFDAPLDTLDVNVMGAARVFEALRPHAPEAVVAITSDKVYLNKDTGRAFAEDDALGGSDPYSGSKSAAEMAIRIWRESFALPLVAARAGNVVGGGDFAAARLLPDLWRGFERNEPLVMRRPGATRPWTHTLDVAEGYLLYAEAVAAHRKDLPWTLNFGPDPAAAPLTVLETATAFAEAAGRPLNWRADPDPFPEKTALAIDSRLARKTLDWSERFPGRAGVSEAGTWYRAWADGADTRRLSEDHARLYAAEHAA